MNPKVERLLDRYYPRQADGSRRGNGTIAFYNWIRSMPGLETATVLNVGAGPTPEPPLRRLRGDVGRLVGVDIDPVVLTNADLHEAHVTDGKALPFASGHFDLVYADWTVEHVENPLEFLIQIRRVLKPSGHFFLRTTNLGHYVGIAAAHTPQWFHRLTANRARGLGRAAHDPWPTFYRMNTPATIRGLLSKAGFDQVEIRLIEPEPAYLQFSPIAFRLGVAYERLVNRWEWSSRLRLIVIARAGSTARPVI